MFDGDDVVVAWGVIVPGLWVAVAMWVEKDNHFGKFGVVLDYISEVDICFAAFVPVDMQRGRGVVYHIDGALPAAAYQYELCVDYCPATLTQEDFLRPRKYLLSAGGL